MYLPSITGLALVATLVAARVPSITDYTATQIANGQAFQNISDIADDTMRSNIGSRAGAKCTYDSASVRREWRTLPEETRQSFTNAVQCLQNMDPRAMTKEEAPKYPGVKTRFDEYVATHINYTLVIHGTADFLAWHRAFVYFLEQDLINLCGYKGVMPYWNWALDSQAPQDSPLFSGGSSSMGSDGKYIAGRADTWLAAEDITYPPGTGGGCVENGPFSNYTVNLGPLDQPNVHNVDTPFEYNPRCLERDLNSWFSKHYNTWTDLTTLTIENDYIEDFQALMQGYGSATNKFGVHGGGHWQVGGSMLDFHSSPADPVFFLHHAMVDRVWTVWQNMDIYNRQDAISGTETINCDYPQCPIMKLTDELPFGFVADSPIFSDLMDTFGGPLCYRYE